MKKKRFVKIVEWDVSYVNHRENRIRDNHMLSIGLIYMIPIIGQIYWIIMLIYSLKERKTYYEEI